MTKEREEAIMRECEAEVYKPVRIDKSTAKDPDDHAWGIEGPTKVGTVWFKNNLSDCEGYCHFLNTVHAEGMFRERLRAEELAEAARRHRKAADELVFGAHGNAYLPGQMSTYMKEQKALDAALDQYRRKP